MPNPTTNPTRLSRTAREVARNPLPGDAVCLPGGYLRTMSSAPNARERFLRVLAQAPAGSTVLPYDGRHRVGLTSGADIARSLISRDMSAISGYLPEILDRWMCSGDGRKSEALTALDFTADIPEAPFVHHAANVLHCMVKFGAPAFVAAKPARDPRNNPQTGDVRITGDGRTWTWGLRPISWDFWRSQNHNSSVRWECGDATAPAKAPVIPNKYGPWPVVSGPPNPVTISVDWANLGAEALRATDLSDITRKFYARRSEARVERRCPRTDPRPGDICILTNDEVEVFTDGTSKEVWRIGGPRIRWIRAEDVVRG